MQPGVRLWVLADGEVGHPHPCLMHNIRIQECEPSGEPRGTDEDELSPAEQVLTMIEPPPLEVDVVTL